MASTGLTGGPHPRDQIDKHVAEGPSIGVYALGVIDQNNVFLVGYVGRSDHNDDGLNGRLHDHDGTKQNCTHFKFSYFKSAKAAFERESQIFHDFEPPWNKAHPPRPAGTNYPCPVHGDACFK